MKSYPKQCLVTIPMLGCVHLMYQLIHEDLQGTLLYTQLTVLSGLNRRYRPV